MLLIKKVKLIGSGLHLIVKRQEGKGPSKNAAEDYDTPVHPDLEAALADLRYHYACLLGLINSRKTDPKKVKSEMVEDFRVNGFFYKGKNSEMIGITGMIKQASGKWTSAVVSPVAIEASEEAEAHHAHMEEMMEKVDAVAAEVNLYLSGDKIGQAKQGELEMPDAPEESDDEDDK